MNEKLENVMAKYVGPFASVDSFESAQRIAKALISSSMVPPQYQGPDNMGNALIALEMAQRLQMSPLMVMQNLVLVHNRPSWSSQFIHAAIVGCGRFREVSYNYVGEIGKPSRGCFISAVRTSDGEKVTGPTITMEMAAAEGWVGKNGSKWKTMPEVMLAYRAISFFGRREASDILMGLHSVEEVRDMDEKDITQEANNLDALNAKLKEVSSNV